MLPIFLLIVGFTVSLSQLLLFREIFSVFQSNDLSIGIMAANVILAFSLGMFAVLKTKTLQNSKKFISYSLLILIVVFFAAFVFIRNTKSFLFIPLGGGISLKTMTIYIIASVFPAVFLQGAVSAFGFCFIRSKGISTPVQTSFLFQGIGFMAGGFFYSFAAYNFFGLSAVLLVAALLCIAAAFPYSEDKTRVALLLLMSLIPAAALLCLDVGAADKKLLEKNFYSSEIVEYKNTSYGQTVLTRKQNEYTLLVNGIIQFSSPDDDILNSEDFGHIPVLYPEKPEKVLIIGGAAKYLPMILSHNVGSVNYLESDAAVTDIIKRNISHFGYVFNDDRLMIYNYNIRKFLEKSETKYDLILVGMPNPINFRLNSYYTAEFFAKAKHCLKKNGFLAVKLPGNMAFSTYIMAELNKSVMESMKSVFRYVHVIPGTQNILIASERRMPYRLHIKKRLYDIQETTLVLSKYYLDDRMDTEKTRWLKNELDKIEGKTFFNSDWNPQAMILSVLHWQSGFSPYLAVFVNKAVNYSYLILIVIIIVFFLSRSVYPTTAFVSGSASVWLFMTTLLAVQVCSGEIYKMAGIFAALFLAGIMLGSFYAKNMKNGVPLNKIMFYTELFFVIWIILLLSAFKFYIINIYALACFAFGSGAIAGLEFMQLTKISVLFRKSSTNNLKLYFFGGAGGVFAAAAGGSFLIPVWGMEKAVLFILFMKFLIFCRWADLKKRGL